MNRVSIGLRKVEPHLKPPGRIRHVEGARECPRPAHFALLGGRPQIVLRGRQAMGRGCRHRHRHRLSRGHAERKGRRHPASGAGKALCCSQLVAVLHHAYPKVREGASEDVFAVGRTLHPLVYQFVRQFRRRLLLPTYARKNVFSGLSNQSSVVSSRPLPRPHAIRTFVAHEIADQHVAGVVTRQISEARIGRQGAPTRCPSLRVRRVENLLLDLLERVGGRHRRRGSVRPPNEERARDQAPQDKGHHRAKRGNQHRQGAVD